jgi:hypothetical protein
MGAIGTALGLPFARPNSAFNPLSLSPSRWYDASQQTGISNNDPAQPPDFSGNNGPLLQATTTKRCTYLTNIQNGRPVYRFDGVDDMVQTAGSLAIGAIIMVVKCQGAGWAIDYPGLLTPGNTSDLLTGSNVGQNSWFTWSASFGTVTYKLNGLVNATRTAPMNAFGVLSWRATTPSSSARLQLGQDRNISGRFWVGDVAECLIWPTALSDANTGLVEAYLKSKWGTP